MQDDIHSKDITTHPRILADEKHQLQGIEWVGHQKLAIIDENQFTDVRIQQRIADES